MLAAAHFYQIPAVTLPLGFRAASATRSNAVAAGRAVSCLQRPRFMLHTLALFAHTSLPLSPIVITYACSITVWTM